MTSFRESVTLQSNYGLLSPHNSEESLHALELDQNFAVSITRDPLGQSHYSRKTIQLIPEHRTKSYSLSVFNYREDLVSLTPLNPLTQATLIKYAACSHCKCNRTYINTWTWREEHWPY